MTRIEAAWILVLDAMATLGAEIRAQERSEPEPPAKPTPRRRTHPRGSERR